MTSQKILSCLLVLNLCSSIYHVHASNNNNLGVSNTPSRKQQRTLQDDTTATTSITLSGLIYSDINQNGQHDANEPGIPNVPVQIRTCAREKKGNTITDSNGEFAITREEGCYYAKLDVTKYQFVDGGGVDLVSGKSEEATLNDGESYLWTLGFVPEDTDSGSESVEEPTTTEEEDSGIVSTGVVESTPITSVVESTPITSVVESTPITSVVESTPITSPPQSASPTQKPVTTSPTPIPTESLAPTPYPTVSSAPTECVINNVNSNTILSSAPIVRASYGMIFSISTPPRNSSLEELPWEDDEDEYVNIKSISMRTLSSITSPNTATDYQVYYRDGNYFSGGGLDARGDLTQWTQVANANSIGSAFSSGFDDQPALIQDTDYTSGVTPSDSNDYEIIESTELSDGGLSTKSSDGQTVKTYLYQIPTYLFTPVPIKKYGGKVSFYVTLDRPSLQYGNAEEGEWDAIDVENADYDPTDYQTDINLRVHVGEGVTSNPWTNVPQLYSPRRFLGKIWYEQIKDIPCNMHVGAPSMAPSVFELPPLPADDVNGVTVKFIDNSRFVVSVFLQQDISNSRKMGTDVLNAFEPTLLDFLNEEYVFGHCIWGTTLNVVYQQLSRLAGTRRQLRGLSRYLQKDITILQAEVLVKGQSYNDDEVCPSGATPLTNPTSNDMTNIGVEAVTTDSTQLEDRLRESHQYFNKIFSVAADPTLLEKSDDDSAASTTSSDFPLVPVVAAIAVVLVICIGICVFCYCRKRKRKVEEEEEKDDPLKLLGENGIPIDIEIGKELGDEAEAGEAAVEPEPQESQDLLSKVGPTMQAVPQLEEVVEMRGLPRRRSEPALITLLPDRPGLRRTRSLGCLRDVWVNLNKNAYYGDQELAGGLMVQLIDGNLYPVEDSDILLFEREKGLVGDDLNAPYCPHSGNIDHNFIDETEVQRIETKPQEGDDLFKEFFPEEAAKEEAARQAAIKAKEEAEEEKKDALKVNPLVMQQVEMLEAKWKQLKAEYGDDDSDSDPGEEDINARIEQLMGHIEDLEDERKNKLAELKRQEEEEEELARKRMVRGGTGINYNQDLNKDFVLRKKKKKEKKEKKKKKGKNIADDLEMDESESESSEEESEEEEDQGDFDIKWMRLKVPLAAQNPEAMRELVEKGRAME